MVFLTKKFTRTKSRGRGPYKGGPMKKLKFVLTERQYEHIITALFEWENIEANSQRGKKNARDLSNILNSLRRQREKQERGL